MGRTKHRKKPTTPKQPERLVLGHHELLAILDRVEHAEGRISGEDFTALKAIAETLAWLTQELGHKGTSLRKLQKLIFGSTSEKTAKVCPETTDQAEGGEDQASAGAEEASGSTSTPESPAPEGEGGK